MFNFKNINPFKEFIKRGKNDTANPNRAVKKNQFNNAVIVFTGIIIIIFFLAAIMNHGKQKNYSNKKLLKNTVVDGVLSSDFNEKNTTSALEEQQREVDALKNNMQKNFKNLNKNLQKTIQKAIDKKNENIKKENLLSKRNKAATDSKYPFSSHQDYPTTQIEEQYKSGNISYVAHRPIQQFSFSYKKPVLKTIKFHAPVNPNRKTIRNYVPAGTFSRGILLEGADADASTNGQSNTAGVLIRLLDNGTIANGFHSKLKGCYIVASIYGDISSERGEVRLDRISCTKHDGSIIQKSVEGYVSFAGKQGVRGRVVSRNGKLLVSSTIAGALSGIGSALQQSLQTINQTPIGTTTSMSPGNIGKAAGYAGAGSAMNMLAKYYIKSANNIHPVIEIPSGTLVTVIFQKGFSLLDNGEGSETRIKHATTSSGLDKKDILRFMAHAKSFTSAPDQSNSDQPFSSTDQ